MATVPADVPLSPTAHRQGLSRLGLSVDRVADEVVIRLSGDLDTYTVERANARFNRHDPRLDRLTVDLTGVRLIDSAGLRALRGLSAAGARAGNPVRFVAPDPILTLLAIGGVHPARG